ncbi:MAG: hypothetical protein DRI61_17130 [Chloroflexi bacterium]|nr:MAG: hypothetical protein DRI61_17130 [Chloroflexota bacterium]
MATECSNHFKYMLVKGDIDFDTDTVKCALMASGFTFDKDAHATWADVSADELAEGNGYTSGGNTLTLSSIAEDDTNDRAEVTYNDTEWIASGGNIGPTPGAILYDDTTADDTVIGYIDFGGDKTAQDGQKLIIKNIRIRIT